jgi:hypothetical protein
MSDISDSLRHYSRRILLGGKMQRAHHRFLNAFTFALFDGYVLSHRPYIVSHLGQDFEYLLSRVSNRAEPDPPSS